MDDQYQSYHADDDDQSIDSFFPSEIHLPKANFNEPKSEDQYV